jgi:glycosyltransferase involved in cell wall biosynthesis
VHSFLTHGYLARILFRLAPGRALGLVERVGNTLFGCWAADKVLPQPWDVVIAFSGIAEDLFLGLEGSPTLKVLQRGSSHIRTQRQILEEEQRRSGFWIEKPSNWIVAREEHEYQLADVIHVLSTFADRSFREHGIPQDKLFHLLLGVSTNQFRASQAVIDARCDRILRGERLRVLNVGTFALRKGALDWFEILRRVGTKNHTFRFIGPVAADARRMKRQAEQWATFISKQPQHELPREYEWGDIFCLPTVEDGFAVVLTQALASGLPLLATTNCAAQDLIREGEEGWVVPIRSPQAFIERLRWCHEHREELVRMIRKVYAAGFAWDWANTGTQAEQNIRTAFHRIYGIGKKEPQSQ